MARTNMYLIPRPGCLVRDPVTKKPLPEEGAYKLYGVYWRRRVMVGDATLGSPPKPQPAPKPVRSKREED